MTERTRILYDLVKQAYLESETKDGWVDWTFENHVSKVAEKSAELALKYGANQDFCFAGALLHDIADIEMKRGEGHDQRSWNLAYDFLEQTGFSKDEGIEIVEKIIKPHSCRELLPITLEGKVMATADAIVHLTSDFFTYFCWQHFGPGEYYKFKEWVLGKIEKDFTRKIFFEEEKEEIKPYYEALKLVYKA